MNKDFELPLQKPKSLSFPLKNNRYENRYINFCFKNLIYDDTCFCGEFSAIDSNVFCKFIFNRKTEEFDIWDNNKSICEILPLPIWWLEKKLLENGKLKDTECRICH